MMQNRKLHIIIVLILLSIGSLKAQNAIQVINQIIPPYSPYLADYTGFDNRIILLLTNNESRQPIDIGLIATLEGDNGVHIETPLGYRSSIPLTINPRQTLRLTGIQLANYLNERSLNVVGVEKSEIFYGSGLPEGNYTLCFRAIDYATGRFLSMPSPMGCGVLSIRNLEPPVILQPYCGDTVRYTKPQNLFINWTIPAGANPTNTEYLLRIVEMEQGIDNPNQAIDAAPEIPFFEKVVSINTYQYSLADPPLISGKKYAFRVTARPRGTLSSRQPQMRFRNNGRSQACSFIYGSKTNINPRDDGGTEDDLPDGKPVDVIVINDPQGNPKDDSPTDGTDVPIDPDDTNPAPSPQSSTDCDASTIVPDPGGTLIDNLVAGGEVLIGNFSMILTTVQKVGLGYNGTGRVRVDFLNTYVNVAFNNIKVNENRQVFGNDSEVIAQSFNASSLSAESFNPNTLNQSELQNVLEESSQPGKQVNNLSLDNDTGISLPLSLVTETGSLIFAGMVFTPTTAYSHLVGASEFSLSTSENPLLFYSLQYFHPFGVGVNQQMNLGSDQLLSLSTNVGLLLSEGSSITFGCEGIEQLNLEGMVTFDRTLLLPLNDLNQVQSTPGRVSAVFSAEITNPNDWETQAIISEAFTTPGLVGFSMDVNNITLDFKTSSSPVGSNKPPNWTGLYIENLALTLPDIFENEGQPIVVQSSEMTLDKFGLSGEITSNTTLADINVGRVGGWPFSIDDFSLLFTNSALGLHHIAGNLKIPISETNIAYELAINSSINENTDAGFVLDVGLGQELDVDMWFATLELDPTSGITIAEETNRPLANLNGSISFGWGEDDGPEEENKLISFNVPSLNFNDFRISSDINNLVSIESFIIDTDGVGLQANFAGFNVNLDIPVFKNNSETNQVGVTFGAQVSLSPGASPISGGTEFTIWGELKNGRYKYKRTQLDAISIDVDIAVAYINGSVEIYDNDVKYGDGFRGIISANIHGLEVGLDATLQVGKVDGYRYWYFDVFVNLGSGIPLPPTVAAINGIGGGAWYNMERASMMQETNVDDLNAKADFSSTPGATADGVIMNPNEDMGFGFSAALSLGIYGAQTMFNADMLFGMEITDNGGVSKVLMAGSGYMFQDLNDRSGAIISGTIDVEIQPKLKGVDNTAQNRPSFHLTSSMNLNLAGMLEGQGSLDLLFSPDDWHIYLGKWTNEDYPENDNSRIKIEFNALNIIEVVFHSYFMAGSDIPPMPQLPLIVRQQFAEDNFSVGNGQRDQVSSSNVPQNGGQPGIAVGAGLNMDFNVKFLIFHMSSEMALGFDVTLLKYTSSPCENGSGFHDWYARGQGYVYLDFTIGVELDLWLWKGNLDLISTAAAAYVNVALPNPTYVNGEMYFSVKVLNGALKFENNFEFEIGEKCKSSGNGPFDYPIISKVTPDDEQSNVNVYSTPEIAFNFPEGPFTYTEYDDGEPVEKTYYYKLLTYRMDWVDAETSEPKTRELVGTSAYRADGYSATFYDQNKRLPAETNVTYTVVAQGWKKNYGPDEKVLEEDEVKTGTFVTGTLPDKIPSYHMAYGRPRYRESYFLTDEFNRGFLELKHPYDHLLSRRYWYEEKLKLGNYQGGQTSGTFKFLAVFRNTKTGTVKRKNLSTNPESRINFDLPSLDNDCVYELSLEVEFTPPFGFNSGNTKAKYQDVLVNGQSTNNGFTGASGFTMGNTGAQSANQVVLQTNFNLLQTQASASQLPINSNVDDDDDNEIFDASQLWVNSGGNSDESVYIQRKERELLKKKKGEAKITFSLFDDFGYYFRTSEYDNLSDKLSQCRVDEVFVGNFGSDVDEFEGLETVVNPDAGYNISSNSVSIGTQIPVVVMKTSENFDEFYARSSTVIMAPNHYKTYNPIMDFSTMYADENWYYSDFWDNSSVDKPDVYRFIGYDLTGDSWEKLEFYGEEGYSIGRYDQLGIPYPSADYFEMILPDFFNDWSENRYKNNTNFNPFGKHDMPMPKTSTLKISPFFTFYSSDHAGSVQSFGGKSVGFTKSLLSYVEPAPEPEDEVFNPTVTYTTNTSSSDDGMSLVGNPTYAYFGIVDYTEWVAMRDFYTLKKYMWDYNEGNINSNYYECDNVAKDGPVLGDFPGANCYYLGVKNYIINHYHYHERNGGTINFSIQRFGTTNESKTSYTYDAPSLNK